MADERPTSGDGGSRSPRGWAPHPPERMLITPLVAGIGGLIAFFVVVMIVVWLPIHTFDPPPSDDWAPLTDQAAAGRQLFVQNNCYVCHSGYTRPQDVRYQAYYLYPKVSQPGDFYGTDQSPNVFGTERTGPDLSQEAGWHPDDWQRAHLWDARWVTPYSLMPPMKALFDTTQVEDLLSFLQTRSGKSGLLRYAGQLYSKHVVLTVQGFADPYPGFEAIKKGPAKQTEGEPPPNQLEEAPNLSQIDRSYWLSADPLPVTQENLLRGKEVFLQRCVSCHGLAGDGEGPAAKFLSPTPADFTDKDDACCGGDTGPGDFYYRILRGWPGTGMENFGDRLSVNDIWRLVLFIKTIPNGTLDPGRVPTPADYIVWQPSDELKAWIADHQPLTKNDSFSKAAAADPFMQMAQRMFSGLAPGDVVRVNGLETTLTLDNAAAGIKKFYDQLLDQAWSEAAARGEKLPDAAQKSIPPTVPGE